MFRRAPRLGVTRAFEITYRVAFAFAFLALLLCGPRHVRAERELDLAWNADAGCPDAAWATARLEERLGRAIAELPGTGLESEVTLRRTRAGFTLTLRSVRGDSADERSLEARQCHEVAEAAVLMIALALEEPPPPPAPAPLAAAVPAEVPPPEDDPERPPGLSPAAPLPATPPEPRLRVRAGGLLGHGELSGTAGGPELGVGYRVSFFWFELGGFWLWPRTSERAANGARVRSGLWALRPRLCAENHPRRFGYGVCAGAELGQISGRGRNLVENQRNQRVWPALTVAATGALRLAGPWFLQGEMGLAAPLDRPRFVSVGAEDGARTRLSEAKPVSLRATLGLASYF